MKSRLERDIRPAVQHARFYPAIGEQQPPLFLVWDMDRAANSYRVHRPTEADLTSLSDAGVPTVVTGAQSAILEAWMLGVTGLVLVAGFGGWQLGRRH